MTALSIFDPHFLIHLAKFNENLNSSVASSGEPLAAPVGGPADWSAVHRAALGATLLVDDEVEGAAERKERRAAAVAAFEAAKEAASPLLSVLTNAELVKRLKSGKNFRFAYLTLNHGVTLAAVQATGSVAKGLYDVGAYEAAHDLLTLLRTVVGPASATGCVSASLSLTALWGKLAAEICAHKWDLALEDVMRLRDEIEYCAAAGSFSNDDAGAARVTLLHWSLFVFFNHPQGKVSALELFFSDKYLQVIVTQCPHLLRYLTVAVVTAKRRRNMVVKDLLRVLTVQDPITQFIDALYARYDFKAAQQALAAASELMEKDFFLVASREEFVESARFALFETYCRLHATINLTDLGQQLGLEADAAEVWIVNLIRTAHLDAKIDYVTNTVEMGSKFPRLLEQLLDRAKSLSYQSYALAHSIERHQLSATEPSE
jgi:translation initiation factor 3 subunit E